MFCTKCGCRVFDGDAFCRNCGKNLNPALAVSPAAVPARTAEPMPEAVPIPVETVVPTEPFAEVLEESNNAFGTVNEPAQEASFNQEPTFESAWHTAPSESPAPAVAPTPVLLEPPATTLLKKFGSSGLFLAAVISYTAFLVLNLIGTIISARDTTLMFDNLTADTFAVAYNIGFVFGAIIGSAPTVVTVIALWHIYGQAKRPVGERFGTGGITTLKVMNILGFVLMGIIALILLLAVIPVAILAKNYSDMITNIAIAIILAVMIPIFALAIVYQIFALRSINALRDAANGISRKVSAFVAVMCYISGAFSLISVFGNVNVVSALAYVALGTANIIFGILMFDYNKQMTN